jgi:mRNA interferase HigB
MKMLRAFWQEHPDAERPLRRWFKEASRAEWHDITDARVTFSHADAVRAASGETMTVFNIAGNKYRLVAYVEYPYGRVFVKRVMTHREYGLNRWKEQL